VVKADDGPDLNSKEVPMPKSVAPFRSPAGDPLQAHGLDKTDTRHSRLSVSKPLKTTAFALIRPDAAPASRLLQGTVGADST